MSGGRDSGQWLDVAQAQAREIWELQTTEARDVAKRVATGIAIVGRVRHFADADAIQHDPDYASKHKFDCNIIVP
jgi:hypothetical protein